jgi:hypothetical protein
MAFAGCRGADDMSICSGVGGARDDGGGDEEEEDTTSVTRFIARSGKLINPNQTFIGGDDHQNDGAGNKHGVSWLHGPQSEEHLERVGESFLVLFDSHQVIISSYHSSIKLS